MKNTLDFFPKGIICSAVLAIFGTSSASAAECPSSAVVNQAIKEQGVNVSIPLPPYGTLKGTLYYPLDYDPDWLFSIAFIPAQTPPAGVNPTMSCSYRYKGTDTSYPLVLQSNTNLFKSSYGNWQPVDWAEICQDSLGYSQKCHFESAD